LFGIPEKEISASPVEANLIVGNKLKEIEEKVFYEPDINRKLKIIESWLFECFVSTYESKLSLPRKLDSLNTSKGILKLNDVFETDANYKKAQRTFREYIGISPKVYARMLRFDSLHNDLRSLKSVDWMNIVAKYKFHDQSHLIKEFKFFTGTTPNDFISKIELYV
jgi:AraC-like DNA-binding protein